MNQNNLACVFGPTVVGHGMSEPSPTTIMKDTNTQPKVGVFFISTFYSELGGFCHHAADLSGDVD